jgi:hypothetical protein
VLDWVQYRKYFRGPVMVPVRRQRARRARRCAAGRDRDRRYRGPGKLEGSIVNWINAPIFPLIGERSGFEVTVEPFAYREGSNISVLSARHRDAYRRPSTHHDDHELATEARDAGFGAVVA